MPEVKMGEIPPQQGKPPYKVVLTPHEVEPVESWRDAFILANESCAISIIDADKKTVW